jgi:hypothetical protein
MLAVNDSNSYAHTLTSTHLSIATAIAVKFVQIIVAKVKYSSRIEDDEANVSSADGLEQEQSDSTDGNTTEESAELWDMLRPLIGDCQLNLLKWEDKEAQVTIAIYTYIMQHSTTSC